MVWKWILHNMGLLTRCFYVLGHLQKFLVYACLRKSLFMFLSVGTRRSLFYPSHRRFPYLLHKYKIIFPNKKIVPLPNTQNEMKCLWGKKSRASTSGSEIRCCHFISNIPVLSDNDQTQKMKRLSFWTLQWSVVSAPQHRLNTRQEVRSAHANKMWRLLSSSSIRHVMLRVLYVMHRFLLEFTAGHILCLPSNLHKPSVQCRFKRVGDGAEGWGELQECQATAWHSGRLFTASPLLPAPASVSEKMARCLCFLWSVLLLEFPEACSCPRCADLPLLSFSLTGRILVMTNLLQCRWRLVELNWKKKKKKRTHDNPFQMFLWHCAHVAGQIQPHHCFFRKVTAGLMLSV